MLSFTTEDYEFEVDGETYSLPEMNIDSFSVIGDLYKITDPMKQIEAFRDMLMDIADDRSKEVIRKLAFKKVGKLFRGWSGLDISGE